MKTVPTLCATSTLVGVSLVGYALALPEQNPLERPAGKRKHSSDLEHLMPSFRLPANASHPFFSGTRLNQDPDRSKEDQSAPVEKHAPRKARRTTIADTASSRQADSDADSLVPSRKESKESLDLGPRLTLRTRPSWMKRFSAASSNEPSPTSSPRSDSPVTVARQTSASRAFSRDGPTRTATASQAVPPREPNKLVKRSTSLRFNDTSEISKRLPSSRRPATSHQRSNTLHDISHSKRAGHADESDGLKAGQIASDTRWRPFFTVKVSADATLGRKRNWQPDSHPLKRIYPEEGRIPHLISAKSLANTTSMEVHDPLEADELSVMDSSRPASAYVGSQVRSEAWQGDHAKEFTTTGVQSQAREHTKLFSLPDVLSFGPSNKRHHPGNRLVRKSSLKSARRVFSDPLAGLGITRASADLERPAKKREFVEHSTAWDSSPNPQLELGQDQASSRSRTIAHSNSPVSFSSATDNSQVSQASEQSPAVNSLAGFPDQRTPDNTPPTMAVSSKLPRSATNSITPPERFTLANAPSALLNIQFNDHSQFGNGSDGLFDHKRPRANRSHSGANVHRFETIYDESPPRKTHRGIGLRESRLARTVGDGELAHREAEQPIEEEENLATPVRTIRSDRADDGSPVAHRLKIKSRSRSPLPPRLVLPSSPPEVSKALSLGTLEYDDELPDDGDNEARWSVFDDADSEDGSSHEDWGFVQQAATPLTFAKSNPMLIGSGDSPSTGPQKPVDAGVFSKDARPDLKSSIFDWSELPADKSPANRSPPRPRTVHGKKDMDGRGSRSVGRRVHSGLHVRSQSVPVVPDLQGKRETVVTNKFGTWGVGSKGVSEDWNDDFDFGDGDNGLPEEREERRIDSGIAMRIPQLIREQQVNVVNNIGLVREFGILIEELKQLRIRASRVGLLDGPRAEIWGEIEAMIDLADQEAEEPVLPPRMSPPSSPGFNSEAFDESAEPSLLDMQVDTAASTPFTLRNRRRSVLPNESDVFDSPLAIAKGSPASITGTPRSSLTGGNRPRKDSEAMARSVIEALKNRSTPKSPLALEPVPTTKKVPFDTNTLRHIVPYVNGLVRAVKNHLKEAEKLSMSPDSTLRASSDPFRQTQAPPLSNLFRDPQESPSTHKSRQKTSKPASPADESTQNTLEEVNTSMKLMTVM